MTRSTRPLAIAGLAVATLVAALAAARGIAAAGATPPSTPTAALLPAPVSGPASLPEPAGSSFDLLRDLPAADLERAAAGLRRHDCAAAQAALAPYADGGTGAAAGLARTVQGLHAHACEDPELAEKKLFAAGAGGPLEDWRLFALADSAAARDHLLVARAALTRLLADHPGSPLRPRALLRAAELAREAGDSGAALEVVERARGDRLRGEAATALEVLAWEIGGERGDLAVQAAAARRLLAMAPAEARRLEIEDRTPGGGPFLALLGAAELAERAESHLAAGDADGAISALDRVPDAERDRAWVMTAVRALTAAHRGTEALSRLTGVPAASPAQEAGLEWARAMAALDAARVVGGRANLPAAERVRMRERARRHLARAAAVDPGGPLAVPALERLFVELSGEDDFDQELAVLRRLRQADPADDAGAERLWELGWREYRQRNHTGAVGYWSELADLYPEHRHNRAGLYWSARAFEALGQTQRAHRLYAEIAAADTTDFYRKHALARLGGEDEAGDPARREPPEPWPTAPVLARARTLSDLGLDGLALAELQAIGTAAPARAAAALEALVLARQGRRRDSIPRIRAAFPALGSAHQAGVPDAALRLYYPLDFEELIKSHAERERLPLHLVLGMVRQESAFDVGARSWAGAHGLMQVMPGTGREVAQRLGLPWSSRRLTEPDYNLHLGTAYFRQVLAMFDGDVELALAGYNGGPYRIRRLWREAGPSGEIDHFLEGLDIPESRIYVKRILLLSDSYQRLYPAV